MGIFGFGKKKALEGHLEESLAELQRTKVLGAEQSEALAMLAKENEGEARLAAERADRLGELSTKDELTEILNRRGFMEGVGRVISTIPHSPEETPRKDGFRSMVVLLLDIDHFKKFNDTMGHAVGDDVLKKVARHLESKLRIRKADIVARYGGEEFILALPGANEKEVLAKLSELRDQAGDKGKNGVKFTEFIKGAEVVIRMSCGITSFRPGEDIKETIERADKALYAAKRAGRDTAIVYDPETMADLDPRGKDLGDVEK